MPTCFWLFFAAANFYAYAISADKYFLFVQRILAVNRPPEEGSSDSLFIAKPL